MKSTMLILCALVALLVVGIAGPAMAGYEAIIQDVTMTAGTSDTTALVTMEGCIREVYLYVPTLDSGDTSTMSMQLLPIPGSTEAVVPNGWTTKSIGATDDGAIVKVLSSTGTIYATSRVKVFLYADTNQAADRVFKVIFIREY